MKLSGFWREIADYYFMPVQEQMIKDIEKDLDEQYPGWRHKTMNSPECLNCNDTGTAIVYGGPARPCSCSKGDKY